MAQEWSTSNASAWVVTLAWVVKDNKVRSRSDFVVAPSLPDAYVKACKESAKENEVVVGVVMSSFAT